MALVKSVKFLHPFFLGKIGLQEVFGAVLDRKEAILDYKNIKGLANGFGQKFEISGHFRFRHNRL